MPLSAPGPSTTGNAGPAALHRLEQSAIAALKANLIAFGEKWWCSERRGRLRRIDFAETDAAATARDLGLPPAPAAPAGSILLATLVPRRGEAMAVRFASLLPWCLPPHGDPAARAHDWLSLQGEGGGGPTILLADSSCHDWAGELVESFPRLTVWSCDDLLVPALHGGDPGCTPEGWLACLPMDAEEWLERVGALAAAHPRLALPGMPLRTEELAEGLQIPLTVVEHAARLLCAGRRGSLRLRQDRVLGRYLVRLDKATH